MTEPIEDDDISSEQVAYLIEMAMREYDEADPLLESYQHLRSERMPMRLSEVPQQCSVEEYLAFERAAEWKHEYRAGRIVEMPHVSAVHVLIVTNVVARLVPRLDRSTWSTYLSQMRLKIEATGLYTYPDVIVANDEARFEGDETDTLVDPHVLIEVVSPTSRDYDHGEKFEHYKTIESLSDYLLIAQDAHRVEHHQRQADDQWRLTTHNGLESVVALESVGCVLPLSEIYYDIPITP